MQFDSPHTLRTPYFMRTAMISILLVMIVFSFILIAIGVHRYPDYWAQRGALTFLLEPVCLLIVYAAAVGWIARSTNLLWSSILPTAFCVGLASALVEILSLSIESNLLFEVCGAGVPLGSMLILFSLWGLAGWLGSRRLQSIGAGITTAVSSAAICMLFGVAGGFLVEFVIAPPSPAAVANWAEFQRSGWTDSHAFAIANTLDSGFTHLLLAPLIAAIVGGLVSLAGHRPISHARGVN
jgi:hypothetical protein